MNIDKNRDKYGIDILRPFPQVVRDGIPHPVPVTVRLRFHTRSHDYFLPSNQLSEFLGILPRSQVSVRLDGDDDDGDNHKDERMRHAVDSKTKRKSEPKNNDADDQSGDDGASTSKKQEHDDDVIVISDDAPLLDKLDIIKAFHAYFGVCICL